MRNNNSTFFYDANAYAKFKNQKGQGHSPSSSLPGSNRSNGSNSPKSSSSSGHGVLGGDGEKSSSSIYYGLNEDMNKLAPQQGRSLRTALNMNGGSTASLDMLATTKKSRSSYISPINELINSSQQHLQFSQLAGSTGGSANGGSLNNATNTSLNYVVNNHAHTGSSPSIPTFMISDNESNSSSPQLTNSSTSHLLTHTRQQSGSLGPVSEEYFDANSQSNSTDPHTASLKKQHQGSSSLRLSTLGLGNANSTTMQNRASRATSMNLLELAKMIEDSMKPGDGQGQVPPASAGLESGSTLDVPGAGKKRSTVVRPPSMVLDSLMRDEEFDVSPPHSAK
ncbi:unnamed protein product [Ambrosiozyma monospora]|uniref:Unnamed protein product n=1 Tax=Ambrosiozyma monospora TaxID=43982 RepID=A0ACB5T6N0_AMBMO|nr:unnamed protein product [Ambrosiozyma monospora]